jgi:hypothetical protein
MKLYAEIISSVTTLTIPCRKKIPNMSRSTHQAAAKKWMAFFIRGQDASSVVAQLIMP